MFSSIAPLAYELAPVSASEDLLAKNRDLTIPPGRDCFHYANGSWLAQHPIPIEEAGWGIGNLVEEDLYQKLRQINETAAAQSVPTNREMQQIGDFWRTAMDEERATRLGVEPLQAELASIAAAQTLEAIIRVSFDLRPVGVDTFFDVTVSQDERQSDVMSVHLEQDGLGLPDRDFYFNAEAGIAHIRQEYVAHMARILQRLGRSETEAKQAAAAVMKLETALAKASRKIEDLRDPENNYHKMALAEVTKKYTPLIDWAGHLSTLGLRPEQVIVGQPEFLQAMNRQLAKTPVPVLQDYLRLHLLAAYAEYLGRDWDAEDFSFAGKVLGGQQVDRPRWKRVLDSQEHAMGMVLGKIFVEDYFPAAAKQRYTELVRAMDLLLQCNQRLVTSGLDESLVLQQALVQIVGRAA